MTRKLLAPLAFVAALLPACGLFKVQTNFSTNGGTSSPGESGPGPGANYDEDALKKSVLATYKSWSFESCKDFECINAFRKKAGVEQYEDRGTYVYYFNPRRVLENPEPEWLTGWDQLTSDEHANEADKVYGALVLAASSKTWLKRCYTDFAEIDKKATQADKDADAAIQKAMSIKNTYARLQAMLDLREKAKKDSKGNSYEDRLVQDVGGRYAIELAVKKAFFDSGRDYLYYIQNHDPNRDEFSAVRPRLSMEKERDSYCLRALRGTPRTPELRQTGGSAYFETSAAAVRPVFSDEQRTALEAEQNDLAKKGAVPFATTTKYQSVGYTTVGEGKGEIAGHPKLANVSARGIPVKSIKKDGDKTVLELTRHSESEYSYDCFETNKVDSIDSNGNLIYRSICKTGKSISDTTMTVSFTELPEGVSVEVGDEIEFYANVVKTEHKDTLKTPALEKAQETDVFEGQHLLSIDRKNKRVGTWFR